MRNRILKELYRRKGEYVSGSELARYLGISRVAVWKHIEALKEEGYDITGISGKGYCLADYQSIIIPSLIIENSRNRLIGRDIRYYPEVDSTNEECKRLLKSESLTEGSIIAASRQKAGKGRLGRRWESPLGGLWFSTILRPDLSLAEIALLSLVFAVAVNKSLSSLLKADCGIKWPNDIYFRGKKMAGILLELSGEFDAAHHVIVGTGINVNVKENDFSDDIRSMSTSLSVELGHRQDINQVLALVLSAMEEYYDQYLINGFTPLLGEFKDNCVHLGKKVEIVQGKRVISGINEDIDKQGNLLINTGQKLVKVSTGDVSIIGI